MKKRPLVSICIPTYNSQHLIKDALDSILNQSYKNFEIIISDDGSKDKTVSVIRLIKDKRIHIHVNKKNLGYGENIRQFKKYIKGDIIYLMAQDDLVINEGIKRTVSMFVNNKNVGVVTRPYYWFGKDPMVAIRHINNVNPKKDAIINIRHHPNQIVPIIESVGQLSGLAYRVDLFSQFHTDVFPAHIYPFMETLRTHYCGFLSKYSIAVGTYDSQTRFKSSIYNMSPTDSWLRMFETVFADKKFAKVRKIAKDHMARNYLGLIQLKNHGKTPWILYREIIIMVKARWQNLFNIKFWFYSLGTIVVPRFALLYFVDLYKETIGKKVSQLT